MNSFLNGFVTELTKSADTRLTRVQTAPTEPARMNPSKTLWQNRLEEQAKRKRLQSQVQKNVQSHRLTTVPRAGAPLSTPAFRQPPVTAPPSPPAPIRRNERRIKSPAGALVYGG